MSLTDDNNYFSEDQAVTVAAASTNSLLLGKHKGFRNSLVLELTVTEAFATTTNMNIKWQESSDDSSYSDCVAPELDLAVANLTLGATFYLDLPDNTKDYLQLYFTPTTTATAGKFTAVLVPMEAKSWDTDTMVRAGGPEF